MVAYIIMALIAYCIGSVNFSVIISKKIAGFDVREKGSGNAGSTNMLRTLGVKPAVLTLICDILKGVVSVLIGLLIGIIAKNANKAIIVEIAALFVVIGHTYPIFFGLKGGKGVATSLGVILIVNWKIGLICLIFALTLMAITRIVSLGSISAAMLFAILVIFTRDSYVGGIPFNASFILFAILLAGLVIFNHRTNLKRIMSGTENRLSFSKNKKAEEKKDDSTGSSKEEIKADKKEEVNRDIKEKINEEKEEIKETEKEETKVEVEELKDDETSEEIKEETKEEISDNKEDVNGEKEAEESKTEAESEKSSEDNLEEDKNRDTIIKKAKENLEDDK